MAEKLDWFENKKMVTHPGNPTATDNGKSYQEQLKAGIYTPPQTLDDLNVLNDMLLVQNQLIDSDGKTLEENIQGLKDTEAQAALAAEQDALAKIAEEQAELASEHLEYLVRGAVLRCRCGTHQRRLNLPECHGVYTQKHPMVHQLDCISGGLYSNIEAFGICSAEGNPSEEKILLKKEILDEKGLGVDTSKDNAKGKPCSPVIVGTWMGANEMALVRENIPGIEHSEKPNTEGNYYPTLTMQSFLVCKYGGLIEPRTSGQEYETTATDFKNPDDFKARCENGSQNGQPHGCHGEDNEQMNEVITPSENATLNEYIEEFKNVPFQEKRNYGNYK